MSIANPSLPQNVNPGYQERAPLWKRVADSAAALLLLYQVFFRYIISYDPLPFFVFLIIFLLKGKDTTVLIFFYEGIYENLLFFNLNCCLIVFFPMSVLTILCSSEI